MFYVICIFVEKLKHLISCILCKVAATSRGLSRFRFDAWSKTLGSLVFFHQVLLGYLQLGDDGRFHLMLGIFFCKEMLL